MNSYNNQKNQEAAQWDDDENSLIDVIRSLLRFLKARRIAVAAIFTLCLLAGFMAAFVLNPILVEVRVKNDVSRIEAPIADNQKNENQNIVSFFAFENFRTLQLSLLAALENRSLQNSNATALDRVKLKFKTQNWIDKNITLEPSIVKSDLRASAIPDKAAEVFSRSATFAFLKITNSGTKADDVIEEARLVATLCIDTALQNQINEFLITQLSNREAEVKKLASSMPLILTEIKAIEQKLHLIKRLKETYPSETADQKTTQLTISNMVGSLADQTKFLPLSTQVTGYEIELGIKRAELDQINFKKKANEIFEIKIQQAIEALRNGKGEDHYPVPIFDRNYWLALQSNSNDGSTNSIITSDYYNNLIEPMRLQLQTLRQRSDLVRNQPLLIDERPHYPKFAVLLVSVSAAFILLFMLFVYDGLVERLREEH